MPCQLCDTISEKEYETISWTESSDTQSRTTGILKKLEMVSFLWGDEWLYKCPYCGQFYTSLSYNELNTGWDEINELRKITKELATIYLGRR